MRKWKENTSGLQVSQGFVGLFSFQLQKDLAWRTEASWQTQRGLTPLGSLLDTSGLQVSPALAMAVVPSLLRL